MNLNEELTMNFDFLRNNIKDLHDDHKKIYKLNEEIAKKLCVSLREPEEEFTKWFLIHILFILLLSIFD